MKKYYYYSVIGLRATGKTYGCVDYALKDFFAKNSKRPFFYVRRYNKTFTPSICGNLVNCHRQDIINLSKGKYNKADLRGKIYTLSRETINERDEQKNEIYDFSYVVLSFNPFISEKELIKKIIHFAKSKKMPVSAVKKHFKESE